MPEISQAGSNPLFWWALLLRETIITTKVAEQIASFVQLTSALIRATLQPQYQGVRPRIDLIVAQSQLSLVIPTAPEAPIRSSRRNRRNTDS